MCENFDKYQEEYAMLPEGFFLQFFRLSMRLARVSYH